MSSSKYGPSGDQHVFFTSDLSAALRSSSMRRDEKKLACFEASTLFTVSVTLFLWNKFSLPKREAWARWCDIHCLSTLMKFQSVSSASKTVPVYARRSFISVLCLPTKLSPLPKKIVVIKFPSFPSQRRASNVLPSWTSDKRLHWPNVFITRYPAECALLACRKLRTTSVLDRVRETPTRAVVDILGINTITACTYVL